MTDNRHWTDRHGPLAFGILGACTAIAIAGVVGCALVPGSATQIAAMCGGICATLGGMHYGRERARQNRVAALAGKEGEPEA